MVETSNVLEAVNPSDADSMSLEEIRNRSKDLIHSWCDRDHVYLPSILEHAGKDVATRRSVQFLNRRYLDDRNSPKYCSIAGTETARSSDSCLGEGAAA